MKAIYEEFREFLDRKRSLDGFFKYDKDEIASLPQRINRSLHVINPTALFLFNNKPLVLFFDKKHQDKEDILQKCWNFAESPIVIVETETDYEIYDGFRYIMEDGKFSLINIDNDKSKITYLSLISGEYFKDHFSSKTDKHIDTLLLKNIKYARERLLQILQSTNKKSIANALIGRIIFIRYLIDRKIPLFYEEDKKQLLSNNDLKVILSDKEKTYQLFKDLQSEQRGFNGDWFPIEENEEETVNEDHLKILKELIAGTDISSGQGSLFDVYDFSIIPIEFISNVYEHFIGEKEQRKDGAYYTPTFLVDYILKHTVDEYFKNNPNEYNCTVLDPACGSGIFLVETFRKLVQQYEKVTGKKADEQTIKEIVKNNIYGIDYNKNALQVAVFSLYLAMLDYQEPKDIENFKFPYLTREKPNFFENDFFETDAEFNKVLQEKKINFIIGNPPYGRGTIQKGSFAEAYIKKEKLFIGNRDVVQPFMVRVKDFCDPDTEVSFIVTSKVLYNLQSEAFRTKNFFNRFKIRHILELSSVRKEIFENATTPVSLLFYKPDKDEEVLNNTFNYISLKPSPYFEKLKLLLISKNDLKKVSQKKVLEFDCLWKILVYGSYLDFNLIKRLKKHKTIDNVIESKAQGITIKGEDKKPAKEYIGMPYIKTDYFVPFYIKQTQEIWEKEFVHRNKKIELFKAPSLLISKGISTSLQLKMGIMKEDSVFSDSITAIKAKDIDTLYAVMSAWSSSLFKYMIFNTGSSIGIEREQAHNPEKFSMPYAYNKDIVKIAKQIEKLQKEHFDGNGANLLDYEIKLQNLVKSLNNTALKTFNLSDQEQALVDFAVNITIPWIMKKQYDDAFFPYSYKDERIEAYVKLFTDHYTALYAEQGLFFQATVYWNQYAIGIYFKTSKETQTETIIWKKEENIRHFLDFANGKKLANLFIQKDIKGFEKDGFYVVKPNEIKNWHKAIGYLDFYEFEDAILKAGKERWKR